MTDGSSTYTLVHIAAGDFEIGGRAKSDAAHFKIVGKPGAKIYFLISGGKVKNLFYVEEKGEDMSFAVAVPKH